MWPAPAAVEISNTTCSFSFQYITNWKVLIEWIIILHPVFLAVAETLLWWPSLSSGSPGCLGREPVGGAERVVSWCGAPVQVWWTTSATRSLFPHRQVGFWFGSFWGCFGLSWSWVCSFGLPFDLVLCLLWSLVLCWVYTLQHPHSTCSTHPNTTLTTDYTDELPSYILISWF